MNINRQNYEEFFLLYVDRELTPADRKAVEDFVMAHPDLEEEFRMLQQSVVRPDTLEIYHDKDSLLKNPGNYNPVNESNYESYFVLYGDDELSPEEQGYVEDFVYSHPRHQDEFEFIQKARLEPDMLIVFPHREQLLREENGVGRVLVMRWWRMAAAAAVLLFLGTYGWFLLNRSPQSSTRTLAQQEQVQPPARSGNNSGRPETALPSTSEPANTQRLSGTIAQNKNDHSRIERQENPSQENIRNEEPAKTTVQKASTDIALVPAQEKSLAPSNYPESSNVQPTNALAASVDVPPARPNQLSSSETKVEAMDQEISFDQLDENDQPPAGSYAVNGDGQPVNILNTSLSNKGKARGFFRKISRVVEKATGLGSDESENSDNRGVRIANFEIALK